ncbi:hypothetical protein ALC60_12288 [Trachymyrmex zeteki]|uniref:Uncharacterized protein n=1 Tax=Mycetomoellerius zeteki TaxID=64791 RepID=A0A151WLL9_9HYME|nr:hypothetical protein ALC60_12288 [Trachymyrmex zeteki]
MNTGRRTDTCDQPESRCVISRPRIFSLHFGNALVAFLVALVHRDLHLRGVARQFMDTHAQASQLDICRLPSYVYHRYRKRAAISRANNSGYGSAIIAAAVTSLSAT